MKVPTPRYRCPLARIQPQQPDVEAVKREGWQEQGILVVALDDERLDFLERELVRRIGTRLYGRKGERHG